MSDRPITRRNIAELEGCTLMWDDPWEGLRPVVVLRAGWTFGGGPGVLIGMLDATRERTDNGVTERGSTRMIHDTNTIRQWIYDRRSCPLLR